MIKENASIEFGSNGAVLNSDSISDELAEKYRAQGEHWSDAVLLKPSKWPPSALIMAFGAAFLLGMRVSTDGNSDFSRWQEVGSLALIVAAGWWRVIWCRKFDKNRPR